MKIARGTLKADGILLLTAVIWGLAFSAQRSGMEHIGPYAYNAVRFALGVLTLLPLLLASRKRSRNAALRPADTPTVSAPPRPTKSRRVFWAALAGTVLFIGSSLQQIGLVSTTAGNAGFITSLYVIIVPLVGVFFGKKSGLLIWIGAVATVAGLYILSVGDGFTMSGGDILVLIGAFFWALHILVVGRFATRMDALELAVGQFAACSLWSLAAALVFEPALFAGAVKAAIPILYGGVLSIGVAFTLQIVAQKTAHPAHASIILSMEALFAGIGGILILAEPLTARLVIGGILMLAGMIVSQLEGSQVPVVAPEPHS
jgi:drug/metabolite transporter (DMT)-like permease